MSWTSEDMTPEAQSIYREGSPHTGELRALLLIADRLKVVADVLASFESTVDNRLDGIERELLNIEVKIGRGS